MKVKPVSQQLIDKLKSEIHTNSNLETVVNNIANNISKKY